MHMLLAHCTHCLRCPLPTVCSAHTKDKEVRSLLQAVPQSHACVMCVPEKQMLCVSCVVSFLPFVLLLLLLAPVPAPCPCSCPCSCLLCSDMWQRVPLDPEDSEVEELASKPSKVRDLLNKVQGPTADYAKRKQFRKTQNIVKTEPQADQAQAGPMVRLVPAKASKAQVRPASRNPSSSGFHKHGNAACEACRHWQGDAPSAACCSGQQWD